MESRKPTYGSAVRMAKLILMLSKSWRPVSVDRICQYFDISLRTAQRYRKALNENLIAADGGKFLRVIKEGGAEKWYLTDQEDIMTATFFRIMSVYVAMALLKSLKGTVIENGMKHVWEMVIGQVKPSIRARLEPFDRKIRYSGFGRKNYKEKNTELEKLLKGLINQSKLQILYYSKEALKDKYYIIRPYTLLLHRDSLYLHAFVERYSQIRTFSVDRIKEVINKDEPFTYPADYEPDSLTDGSFGIYEAPDTSSFKVRVSFKESLWEYITTRRWHPTQRFSRVKDGTFTMEVNLTNTNEFIPWVLQFGSDAKVLEPETLREKIKKELLTACENY
ncbi:MAG: WYL domain-containing transcriptional regulator [Thermodesulfobacteriota bacterium]|nr:WYL domain-containing transcriptional regulator [Thermodesulfobacteriota bacterium]